MNIDELFEQIALRERKVGWVKLSESERYIAIAMMLRYEVGNGGFEQYYFNSTGDLAIDAPEAFEKIGAHLNADVVKRANGLFGPEGPSRDREQRVKQLSELTQYEIDAMCELDPLIYDDNDDLEELIPKYVKNVGLE